MEAVYIPPDSQKRLIKLSRQTLEGFVQGRKRPVENIGDPYLLTFFYGAFVSLHKGDELRGCIGTCFPKYSLYETIIEMTEAAASRDHRVRPVCQEELAETCIEISVLSPLEWVADPLSLEVGKHGLHIECEDQRGVLLPQVATQYRWNMETFLDQACVKAGLPRGAWKSPETRVSCFTALIIEEG